MSKTRFRSESDFRAFKTTIVLTTLAICVFLFTTLAGAAKPDTIISRHISAVGGRGKIKSVRNFTIEGRAVFYGILSTVTFRGIYQDYFEMKIKNDIFEVVRFRSPKGEFIKTADGVVRELSGHDSEGLYALSAIFNYAYIKDMSLPLVPESEVDPEVFTMDTGANFGTVITLDPETNLIISIALETGGGAQKILFEDYASMGGVNFPEKLIFMGETKMALDVESLKINSELKPEDFVPPAESTKTLFLNNSAEVEIALNRINNQRGQGVQYIALNASLGGTKKKIIFDTDWGGLPVVDKGAGELPGEAFEHRTDFAFAHFYISRPLDLTFGAIKTKLKIKTPVFVSEEIGKLFGEKKAPADGLLGYSLMAKNPVGLNLKENKLTIYNRENFTVPDGAKKVRMIIDGGRPVVSGVVDGVSGTIVIDTGFGGFGYIFNKSGDKKLFEVEGGGIIYTAKSLNFGGIVFEDAGLELTAADASHPDLIIVGVGLSFLEKFNVIFDYAGGVLYLSPIGE